MSQLADCYSDLGRHADALELHQKTLAGRKVKLGPDDPETVRSMKRVAQSLVRLGRGAEAVPILDDCIRRIATQGDVTDSTPDIFDLRLRHFEKIKDAPGCRATAEMWEKLTRRDADSLYNAACFRAVTAAVVGQSPSADAPRLAKDEADRAMMWLRHAVAAGFNNMPHLLNDSDLAPLRGRADYADLLWEFADRGN
jgi:hypothetical protein